MQTPAPFSILETLQDQLQHDHELDMQRLLARAPEFSAIHEAVEGLAGHGATSVVLTNVTLLAGYTQGSSQDLLVFAIGDHQQRQTILTAVKATGFDVWQSTNAPIMCVHPAGWMLHIDMQVAPAIPGDTAMAIAA